MSESCCHPDKPHVHGNVHGAYQLFKNKIFILALGLLVLIAASYGVSFLEPFRQSLLMYFGRVWWAVALGLLLGGAIDYYVPSQLIAYALARRKKRTILNAVLLGSLMSICSHGILALSIQLYKKGASTSSVVAFLLASPWANFPLTLLLISFFGVAKALFIIASAVVIAVVTGLCYQVLEDKKWVESNPAGHHVDAADVSVKQLFAERFKDYQFSAAQLQRDAKGVFQGIFSLADMVLWWMLLGIALASASAAYIPAHLFHNYMGPTFGGMMVTLAVATIIEVCSEGSSPIAFEIYRQTGSVGNSLVFLMAGVATDYTEIGLLWQNVGRKTALWLPALTVPQIIFWGMLANIIF